MLCLRDPADETNDLGRKGKAIKHVQATFRHLHRLLLHDIEVNTRPSLLDPAVGSSYTLHLARRKKLQQYGERLQRQTQQTLAEKARLVREADREGQNDAVEVDSQTGMGNGDPTTGYSTV